MGEILIDWEGHDEALSNKLLEFLREEYLVDFSVTCHGLQKKVHKLVFVLLLPILKESLRSSGTILIKQEEFAKDGRPAESNNILLPQCLNLDNVAHHAEDMDYLIEFAYTGKTTVPKEHANCMLHIADSMGIASLKKSLFQWHCDGGLSVIPQSNDVTTRFSLGSSQIQRNDESVGIDDIDFDIPPVIKQEPIIEESMDTVGSDLDIPWIGNEESRLGNSIEGCDNKEDGVISNLTETGSDELANSGEFHESPTNERNAITKDVVASQRFRLLLPMAASGNRNVSFSRQFVCKICNVGFEKGTEYVAHRDSNCGTECPTCKYCGHQTSQKTFLKRHIMAVHHVDMDGNPLEMNVKCTECDFACYASHSLRAHMRVKHEDVGRFKCKECSFTAPNSSRLKIHERFRHKDIREFTCEECGKQFRTKDALNNHVLTVHLGVKPYVCDICGMKYKNKTNFKHHMKGHTDTVRFKHVCDICGYRTKGKPNLKIHMRRDHGIDLNKAGKTEEKALPEASFELETVPIECTLNSI